MDELNTSNEVQMDVVDSSSVDNTQTEQVETSSQSENNVEVAEPQKQEKPVQTAEDNATYRNMRLKAEAEAEAKVRQKVRDEWIAEQGYEWNGKHIRTESEYQQALHEKELTDKGYDPNEIKQLLEEHPEVKRAKEITQQAESIVYEQHSKQALEGDPIKSEIYKKHMSEIDGIAKGLSSNIRDKYGVAYTLFCEKLIETQLANDKKSKVNAENAKSSMGSVTGQGETTDGFISFETFEAKKTDRNWIMKNLTKITKSRAKW